MKVAFLVIGGLEVASSRYRVWQYLLYLQQSSIEADIIVIPKNNRERWKLFKSLSKYDLTFIQKKLFQPWEIAYIRSKSRKLVYDLDDSVMYKHTDEGNKKSFTRWFNFRQTIRKVDLVLAGNSYLMEEVKKYNNNVELLPTVLDTEPYKPVWDNKSNEKLTLGWIGSKANLEYLASIAEALDELSLTFNNLELKIVADDFISLKKMPVVEKKWAIEDEITDLQSFDIGIMPLSDDVWTRGKCGFKLLQYMATGIPVICSPVGANKEIVNDGYNGFLATTSKEWFSKLSLLIKDAQLRKEMGKRGREIVENNYSLESVAPKFVELLRKV